MTRDAHVHGNSLYPCPADQVVHTKRMHEYVYVCTHAQVGYVCVYMDICMTAYIHECAVLVSRSIVVKMFPPRSLGVGSASERENGVQDSQR